MATEQIIRDILEVNSRLFDHRPILQGHIRAFVKEFEEKRGDREVTRLNNVKVLLTDLKDRIIPETKSDLDTSLTNIEAKVRVALEVCKKIEEKENNVEVGYLDLQRGRRKEEWDLFMQQQFEKSAKVDEEMDAEMKKLSAEYVELEKNLEKIPITAQ